MVNDFKIFGKAEGFTMFCQLVKFFCPFCSLYSAEASTGNLRYERKRTRAVHDALKVGGLEAVDVVEGSQTRRSIRIRFQPVKGSLFFLVLQCFTVHFGLKKSF